MQWAPGNPLRARVEQKVEFAVYLNEPVFPVFGAPGSQSFRLRWEPSLSAPGPQAFRPCTSLSGFQEQTVDHETFKLL
jgi:hypothetical protein